MPCGKPWPTPDTVQRVSNKASHDYAEVFDGVPSQHDGKDAAVVAELATLGKAQPSACQPASPWEQELEYWVEWMVAHRQILTTWQGRLEGLLAHHWPEATSVLKLSSGTLLRVLKRYGDPKALAADPEAAKRLARWGRALLSPEKIEPLRADAGSSVGVRVGEWERRRMGDYEEQAWRHSGKYESGTAVSQIGHRDARRSRPKGRWWVCRRRVSCGRARETHGSIMRPPPTARRWG